MRMAGRGLVVIAATALTLAAAACGGSTSAQGTSPSGNPIPIGFLTPLSAPGDFNGGNDMLNAAQVWVKYTNSHGGIIGHPVKLALGDDKGTPDVAGSEARRLIAEEKVVGLTGQWTGATAKAEMPVAQRYNVPIVIPYAWSDELTGDNLPQIFRVGPYNSKIAALFAPYLKHKAYTNVALFADSSDYAQGFAKALVLSAHDTPKINVVNYDAHATDLTPEITKVMSNPPDAIVIAASFVSRNLIINQARQAGFKGDIIAGWDYTTTPDYWQTVKDNGVGVVYPTFYAAGKLPLTRTGDNLAAALKSEMPKYSSPVVYQFYVWDCLDAFKWAIEKTNSTDPGKLVAALAGADYEGTMGRIRFTNQQGTPDFHQWLGFTMFFKKMDAVGQTDTQSSLVYTVQASAASG